MLQEELTIYEEEIAVTSGLSSMGQIVDRTSNNIFSFMDIASTGEELLIYIPSFPIVEEESEKEKFLREFKSIVKKKLKDSKDFKKLYYEQLEQKYKDVF